MTPEPHFTVQPKGSERGFHALIAWLAVAALTIAFRSREKARRRWETFATLMPSPKGWVLYRSGAQTLRPSLIVHENQHVADARAIGTPLFCLLYVINPITVCLVVALATLVSPWFWLALLVCGTPNPARAWLEWRAYRTEWRYLRAQHGEMTARRWSQKLPRLFAGPDYGFMSPLLGFWLWWRIRRKNA